MITGIQRFNSKLEVLEAPVGKLAPRTLLHVLLFPSFGRRTSQRHMSNQLDVETPAEVSSTLGDHESTQWREPEFLTDLVLGYL